MNPDSWRVFHAQASADSGRGRPRPLCQVVLIRTRSYRHYARSARSGSRGAADGPPRLRGSSNAPASVWPQSRRTGRGSGTGSYDEWHGVPGRGSTLPRTRRERHMAAPAVDRREQAFPHSPTWSNPEAWHTPEGRRETNGRGTRGARLATLARPRTHRHMPSRRDPRVGHGCTQVRGTGDRQGAAALRAVSRNHRVRGDRSRGTACIRGRQGTRAGRRRLRGDDDGELGRRTRSTNRSRRGSRREAEWTHASLRPRHDRACPQGGLHGVRDPS